VQFLNEIVLVADIQIDSELDEFVFSGSLAVDIRGESVLELLLVVLDVFDVVFEFHFVFGLFDLFDFFAMCRLGYNID